MQQWTNGNYSTANAGGGGGIGAAGASGVASTNRAGIGGNGLNAVTINSVTYNFSNHFANGGVFGVNGYIGGGGGGGGYTNSPAKISGGLGGGGTGDCAGNNTVFSDAPTNGAANTGSGGGGAWIVLETILYFQMHQQMERQIQGVEVVVLVEMWVRMAATAVQV